VPAAAVKRGSKHYSSCTGRKAFAGVNRFFHMNEVDA